MKLNDQYSIKREQDDEEHIKSYLFSNIPVLNGSATDALAGNGGGYGDLIGLPYGEGSNPINSYNFSNEVLFGSYGKGDTSVDCTSCEGLAKVCLSTGRDTGSKALTSSNEGGDK